MRHDLVIHGGIVVDGNGCPPRTADVAGDRRETDALTSRPPHFARRSHWEPNRTPSRLRAGGR